MSRTARPRYPLSLRVRTAVNRRHRLVAAALLAVVMALLVLRFAPPNTRTTTVITSVAPVAAGEVIRAEHVSPRDYPADLVPVGAISSPGEVVGRPATVSLGPGTPLTPSLVLGPCLLAHQPEGTTAASVRVSDPATLQNIRPGDRVDVVHLRDRGARSSPATLAQGVTVLWVADATTTSTSIMPSGSETDSQGLVVLATDRKTASTVAALDGSGTVSLVLVGG